MIKIENLYKYYGRGSERQEVLKGLTFELPERKILCVLGPSGSGKSTLLNILGGLETIDDGRVEVFGHNLAQMTSQELEKYRRNNLGFVFQFYNLVSHLNVYENMEVGKYLAQDPLDIDKLIDDLGLRGQQAQFPNELSGGQAQRTAIGRAMIKRPRLLICDEPTGALDYESAKDVLLLIEKLNSLYGSTVIIATHNTQIAKMCDLVLALHNGKIKSWEENPHKIAAREVAW